MRDGSYSIVIVLIITALLSACGSNAGGNTESISTVSNNVELSKDQVVTITFYSYNLGNAVFGKGTEMLINEFMELHPNIKVEGVAVPSPDINARVQADVVAGSPPDVAQLVFDGLDFFVHNLNAKPLETLASPEDLKAHFQGFSEPGRKLTQINNLTYGLPFTFSTPILFYNADIFREAGLDPDQPPKTWEQVKEYGQAIVNKTSAEGVQIAAFGPFDWLTQSLIKSNGGQVLSEDRKTIMFGEPEAIEAIGMWKDLAASGIQTKLTSAEASEAMYQGKMGMMLNTSALQNTLIKSAEAAKWELRAAAMPSFGEKPTAPVNSGSALFVLSDDPIKQAAAWEFLKFVTSERGYTIITSEIGYLPLRPAIVDDPKYLKEWVDKNPLVKPNLQQLERLSPWISYPGPSWKQIETLLQNAVEQAVLSDGDTAQIMQDAQKRAQSLMPNR